MQVTQEQYDAIMARNKELEEKLSKATKGGGGISVKVSEKRAASVYGLGRFPVTLYASQWNRLLDNGDKIRQFLNDHADRLATKD